MLGLSKENIVCRKENIVHQSHNMHNQQKLLPRPSLPFLGRFGLSRGNCFINGWINCLDWSGLSNIHINSLTLTSNFIISILFSLNTIMRLIEFINQNNEHNFNALMMFTTNRNKQFCFKIIKYPLLIKSIQL